MSFDYLSYKYINVFLLLKTFPAELPIFIREHQNRMYSVISYYLARVVLDLPIFIVLPFIFTTICYWMADLNNDLSRFLICAAMLILVAQTAVSFGTFLSACAPNTNSAIALSGPIIVPFMIFSGFLLNSEYLFFFCIFLI